MTSNIATIKFATLRTFRCFLISPRRIFITQKGCHDFPAFKTLSRLPCHTSFQAFEEDTASGKPFMSISCPFRIRSGYRDISRLLCLRPWHMWKSSSLYRQGVACRRTEHSERAYRVGGASVKGHAMVNGQTSFPVERHRPSAKNDFHAIRSFRT